MRNRAKFDLFIIYNSYFWLNYSFKCPLKWSLGNEVVVVVDGNLTWARLTQKLLDQRTAFSTSSFMCIQDDGIFAFGTKKAERNICKEAGWWICFLQTRSFSLHKTVTDGLEWCGLLVDYCDVFISCLDSFWRHPFTAEDPLVSKWCNATFLQIYSD